MKECSVCCEKYNQTIRKAITCAHCNYSACRGCHKMYMMQSIREPHCMSCKIPWDSEMILSNFTKSFFQNDFRKHREMILFEREKSLLPATQQEMREENLNEEMVLLLQLARLYKSNIKGENYRKEAQRIADELGVPLPGTADVAGPSKKEIKIKVRPMLRCISDNCKGFVMSNNWRCGLCDMKVCHECLKMQTEDHVCVKEDTETCKLLLSHTKPCPKCGVMINKVAGCNMMWCVMCHTTFDWASGETTTAHNHNPHYYEWLRRSGRDVPREPGDVPHQIDCGNGLPDPFTFSRVVSRKYTKDECDVLLGLLRLAHHILTVEMDILMRKMRELDNTHLRKDFLRGDLTEDAFKREIFIRERTRERSRALNNVMMVAYAQLRDVMLAFYNEKPPFESNVVELSELMEYCNGCFAKIGSAYNCRPFKITSSKNFYTISRN